MTPEEYRALPTAKRSKYSNKKVVVDGIKFESQKEAKRYGQLKMLERAGEITGLQLQPTYRICIDGKKVCSYKGDFFYHKAGKAVVEDVKGFKTPAYQIKKKLMKAIYGIEILET